MPDPYSHAQLNTMRQTQHDPTTQGFLAGGAMGVMSGMLGSSGYILNKTEDSVWKKRDDIFDASRAAFKKEAPSDGFFNKAGHSIKSGLHASGDLFEGMKIITKHAFTTPGGGKAGAIIGGVAATLGIGAGLIKANAVSSHNQQQLDAMIQSSIGYQ